MSAIPKEFSSPIEFSARVSEDAVRPFPQSQKVYITGSRADIRVPMRQISLSDTPVNLGAVASGVLPQATLVHPYTAEKNPPVYVYDTSGPYTDSHAHIDLRAGLPALRTRWIEERGDSETLDSLTSEFGRRRAHTVCGVARAVGGRW